MTAQRIAADLIAELDSRPGCVAHSSSLLGRYNARRTEAGTLVFWGRTLAPTYRHTMPLRAEIPRTYVRAKNEAGALAHVITRALAAEREQRPLLQAREALFVLAESRDFDATVALAEQHPELPTDYDKLSLADCAAWTPLLQALPGPRCCRRCLPPGLQPDPHLAYDPARSEISGEPIMPNSYAPQVRTGNDPKFYGNALRFATRLEAEQNVADLAGRWWAVVATQVVESDDPPNYTWADGKLGELVVSL